METEKLLSLFYKFNEWWETRSIPNQYRYDFKRNAYEEVLKYLRTRQIVSIVGLRRTGKTVLMHQIIEHLLKQKINPKQILYFSFDEVLIEKEPEIIENIIETFLVHIAERTEKKYIFLDEIQYIPYWQAVLKRYYDVYPDVKFIISGSASLTISKKGRESLAGRIFDIKMGMLSFKEFIELRKTAIKTLSSLEGKKIERFYYGVLPKKEILKSLFNEYIFKGGFPEIVFEADTEVVKKYILNSVINKIVTTDIPLEYNIKQPNILLGLLQYTAKESSQLFEIKTLADMLGVDRETVSNYLSYLQSAFLINISYNFTKSFVKRERMRKKIFMGGGSMIAALNDYDKTILQHTEILGKIVETIVFNHCTEKYKVSFWRDKQKREVDLVIEHKNKTIPIEVKYRNEIHKNDLKNIRYFMENRNIKTGFMLTKDLFRSGKNIVFLPVWLFLLIM